MTADEAKERFKVTMPWVISNAGNLALLGGALWFAVRPAVSQALEAEVRRIAPIIVAEQVEERFTALESGQKHNADDLDTVKKTQQTIIYQQGEINKKLPDLETKVDTIIRLLSTDQERQ